MISNRLTSSMELMQRFGFLKSERYNFERIWQEIINVCAPFNADVTTERSGRTGRIPTVFDSTGMLSSTLFANFMKSAIFPSSEAWLKFELNEERFRGVKEIDELLDAAAIRILKALSASNFYVQASSVLRDFSVLGNGVVYVEELPAKLRAGQTFGGLQFQAVPIAKMWWMCGSGGQPILTAREHKLPAVDAYRFFKGNPGKRCLELLDQNKLIEMCSYVQFCYVNENGIPGGLVAAEDKPWISTWITLDGETETIRTSGYDYAPYTIARCYITEGEAYGRGHGHLARPDILGISEIKRQVYIATSKDLLPPLMVGSDTSIQLNAGPNSVITIRDTDQIQPSYLNSGTRYDVANNIAASDRDQIRKIFLADHLGNPETQPRSAEESIQRRNRAMQALSAPADAILTELVDPLISNVVSIMQEAGALPEFDRIAELTGGETEIEIKPTSPIFTAQKAHQVNKILANVNQFATFSNLTQDPSWMDYIDQDSTVKMVREFGDVPARGLKSDEEVFELRAARAQRNALLQESQLQAQQQPSPEEEVTEGEIQVGSV